MRGPLRHSRDSSVALFRQPCHPEFKREYLSASSIIGHLYESIPCARATRNARKTNDANVNSHSARRADRYRDSISACTPAGFSFSLRLRGYQIHSGTFRDSCANCVTRPRIRNVCLRPLQRDTRAIVIRLFTIIRSAAAVYPILSSVSAVMCGNSALARRLITAGAAARNPRRDLDC